jgi:hypothetical protein
LQAQQVRRGARNGIGFAMVALILAAIAVIAITFLPTRSAHPVAHKPGAATQSGYDDLQPDRTQTRGQIP